MYFRRGCLLLLQPDLHPYGIVVGVFELCVYAFYFFHFYIGGDKEVIYDGGIGSLRIIGMVVLAVGWCILIGHILPAGYIV